VGWGKDLIGLESTIPVVSFIPMFLFAILFGLSMDYEVFLLSRMREHYVETHDNDPTTKMFGLGLAMAIFVDATIIRIVLVPSTMKLLGDANWWLPAWLDRLLPAWTSTASPTSRCQLSLLSKTGCPLEWDPDGQ
jgi:RND superfamily putative drug exporter